MKLDNIELEELNPMELVDIHGGSEFSEGAVWFLGGLIRSAYIFALEGGRNASICVK